MNIASRKLPAYNVAMADTSLVKKLQIKAGQRLAVINAPGDYRKVLGELPEGTSVTDTLAGPPDFVLVYAQTSRDGERLTPEVMKALKPNGLFWVCYPKGTSKVRTDLNRDILWGLMQKFRLAGVSMVSLDDVWSAMRFRPAEKVGK